MSGHRGFYIPVCLPCYSGGRVATMDPSVLIALPFGRKSGHFRVRYLGCINGLAIREEE